MYNNLLYKEIDEVKPGTYLEIDAKFQIKIINYHKPQNINKDINYKNYIKKVTKTLTSNFKNSLTSDRPLALIKWWNRLQRNCFNYEKKKIKKMLVHLQFFQTIRIMMNSRMLKKQ